MIISFKSFVNNYLNNYIRYLLVFFILVLIGIYFVSKTEDKYRYEVGIMLGSNNTSNYVYKISKLIKTDLVLNDVKNNLNINYSLEELRNNILLRYDTKSEYINIIFIFKEKKLIKDISNELISSLKTHSNNIYNESNIVLVNESKIRIINTKSILKILIFIFSLIISFIVSVIVYLYNRIKEFNKIKSDYKPPVIKKIE